MSEELDGVSVGIFIAPKGTEQVEFTQPRQALEEAGAELTVLSSEEGQGEAVKNDLDEGDAFEVDETFKQASAGGFDALVVPGGTVGVDRMRMDTDAVGLLREHVQGGRPAGVICHGPWMLVEADLVQDRTLTSFPSLRTDIENAGGRWVDKEVVQDDGVVTSRTPEDLDAFCNALVETFQQGPV